MKLNLYHATTSAAADEIDRTQQFLPGTRGYAGGAVYFSAEQDSAFYHCRSSSIDVMIRCSVDLGKCLNADKNTVDAHQCVSRGFDSVKIHGTDTYAVYDPSRISIQEFSRIGDVARWYPSMSKLKRASRAVTVLLAAVHASPAVKLKVHCMSQLYDRHCDLRRTIDAEGGLRGFCEAHAELAWTGNSVSLGPKAALEIIITAIQTSPNGSLNVSGDMAQLCSKHHGLRDAFGVGGLEAFCKAHDQLTWSGSKVAFSKKKKQDDVRQMRLRRLSQKEEGRKQVEEVRHQVQLQKEMRSKREAAHEMQMKREKCARQQEQSHPSSQERCELQLQSAAASTAEADAAGGLKGLCENHAELTWAGNSVALVGSRMIACKEQLQRSIQEEEEARQQAKVAQRHIQLCREMRLKQEAAQQWQMMKEDENTRQQEHAQRSAEARHQLKLDGEVKLEQKPAQHTKTEDARPRLYDRSALQAQQKQDTDARQLTQITYIIAD